MENRLYCLTLGETMRDRFLADARNYEYGKALFLVPNRFFARLVKQQGVVKAAAIDYLAGEILRYNHREQDYKPVQRSTQKKIIRETLTFLGSRLTYFGTLAAKQGFQDSLLQLFDEFSQNGLTPDQYHSMLLHWSREGSRKQKDLELDLLYHVYCSKLENQQLYDLAGLYKAAAQVLEQGGTVPWDKVYFSEFYTFDPVQLQLVEALAKQCSVEIGLFYDPKRPELSAVTEKIYATLYAGGFTVVQEEPEAEKPADLGLFAKSWKPGTRSGAAAEHVRFGKAATVEQEIRLALSDIKARLQKGTAPEDILLIVRRLQDYQGLARSFAEYGIPCALPQVTGLAGQSLPDFLTKLFGAVQGSNQVDLWQNLLDCPLVQELWHGQRDTLAWLYTTTFFATARELLAYVKRQQLIDTGFWDVLAFCQESHTAGQWREQFLLWLDSWQLAQKWGSLHQEGKLPLLQVKVMSQTVEFVRTTLENFVRRQEQCGEQDELLSLQELSTFWQDSLQGGTVTLEQGSPRGIRVLEAGEVQGLAVPYVYILGVREGVFPAVKRESWLYSDQERIELNGLGLDLSIAARSLDTDRYFFGSVAALASRQLWLSWYEDEDGGASAYIQDLENFFAPGSIPLAPYENTLDTCYSASLLTNDLVGQGACQKRERAFLAQRLGEDFFARTKTEQLRWEGGGAYNGLVPGALESPLRLSASALDAYLQCPFAFLMGRVWRLEPWEPMDDQPAPNVVGSLIHEILAKFVGRHKDRQLLPEQYKEREPELQSILDETFQAYVKKGDIPDTASAPHWKKLYGKWLRTWLKKECAYEAEDPLALKPSRVEWAFGRAGSKWRALPYDVDGETVYFSGQIDRIDTNGKDYVLWDYKTGDPPKGTQLSNGQVVQLPLYLLALQQLGHVAPETILGAGYYAMRKGERSGGLWTDTAKKQQPWLKSKRPPAMDEVQAKLGETIGTAVRALRQGRFPANPQSQCPDYCPAKDICRWQENPHKSQEE